MKKNDKKAKKGERRNAEHEACVRRIEDAYCASIELEADVRGTYNKEI